MEYYCLTASMLLYITNTLYFDVLILLNISIFLNDLIQVSLTKMEGSLVTDHQVRTMSQGAVQPAPISSPAATPKSTALRRKATPARFITPLQGIIVKEDDKVLFECIIDGETLCCCASRGWLC